MGGRPPDALLVVGVAAGAMHVVAILHLTKELLFALFLPGLLFEAAYHLEWRELRENACKDMEPNARLASRNMLASGGP